MTYKHFPFTVRETYDLYMSLFDFEQGWYVI